MERHNDPRFLMEKLGISEEEANLLIEFDKTVTHKPEPKIKAQKAVKAAPAKSKPKATGIKEAIFAEVSAAAEESSLVLGVQSLKANAITFKDADGNYYTLALTAHKACPAGYAD